MRILPVLLAFLLACGSSQPEPFDEVDASAADGGSHAADTAGAGGAGGIGTVGGTGGMAAAGSGGTVNGTGGSGGASAGGAGGTSAATGGTTGARTGGITGSGSGGMPADAGVVDTRPADTSPATYPFCRDPDKVSALVACARVDEYKRTEWQRKDGYRCAICTWNRPTGVEQQVGCIKPVPQIPGMDSTHILCTMTCNECAY